MVGRQGYRGFGVLVRVALALMLLVPIGLTLSGSSARAATFEVHDTVFVSTDYLNLRSNPGTDGSIRDVLEYGTELQVIDGPSNDDGYVWYKVVLADADFEGWVAEDYIAYSLDGGDGGGSSFVGAKGVRVVDGPVNVRDDSSLDGSIDSTLSTGAEVPTYGGSGVTRDADGYTWIHILYGNGIQGWIATDFLEPLDYSPNLGSDDGWSTAKGAEVIDGPVNRRAAPGLDSAILDTLSVGAVSSTDPDDFVTADGYTWVPFYRLTSTTKWGWVAMDFLSPLAETPCIDGPCYPDEVIPFLGATEAIVTDGPVNFRSGASTSGDNIMTLEDGDYLFLDPQDNRFPPSADGYFWIAATVDGQFGYVALDYITALD